MGLDYYNKSGVRKTTWGMAGEVNSSLESTRLNVDGIVSSEESDRKNTVESFSGLYINSIKVLHEQLSNGDIKFALKTISILGEAIREYLLNHATLEESEDFLNSLIALSRNIVGRHQNLRKEDLDKILLNLQREEDFIANFIFVRFYNSSTEDKDFVEGISEFVKRFGDKVSFLNFANNEGEKKEEDIDVITFSCIGHMDEFLTFPGKTNTLEGIYRLMRNYGNNEIFVRGCLSYIVSRLKIDSGNLLARTRIMQLGNILCENIDDKRLKGMVTNEIIQNSAIRN